MCQECESRLISQPHNSEEEYWKLRFQCVDCKENTNNNKDYYMVIDDIWESYGAGQDMLCIACLEKRIGRSLEGQDFLNCPLNLYFNPYVKDLILKYITTNGSRKE